MKELKIALIHATPLAMEPVSESFSRFWPRVRRMNLLDDCLSQDLAAAGSLDDAMTARIVSLARYAQESGAHGILFTCSAFGPAVEEAARTTGVPTLKPNEAMFAEALAYCAGVGDLGCPARVGLLTTFAPAALPMRDEFLATAGGADVELVCECADGAMAALNAGNAAEHDRLVVAHAQALAQCDVVMLGQFSMARSQSAVANALGKPVLTSPDSAVRLLQRILATPG